MWLLVLTWRSVWSWNSREWIVGVINCYIQPNWLFWPYYSWHKHAHYGWFRVVSIYLRVPSLLLSKKIPIGRFIEAKISSAHKYIVLYSVYLCAYWWVFAGLSENNYGTAIWKSFEHHLCWKHKNVFERNKEKEELIQHTCHKENYLILK